VGRYFSLKKIINHKKIIIGGGGGRLFKITFAYNDIMKLKKKSINKIINKK